MPHSLPPGFPHLGFSLAGSSLAGSRAGAALKSLLAPAALAVVLAGASQAAPVTVSAQDPLIPAGVNVTLKYGTGDDPFTVNTAAGAFALTSDTAIEGQDSTAFFAFCVDIFHSVYDGFEDYRYETTADSGDVGISADGAKGLNRLIALQALFDNAYASLVEESFGNAVHAAGFQMAIWEVLYETKVKKDTGLKDTGYWNLDVTKGAFRTKATKKGDKNYAAAATYANELLKFLYEGSTDVFQLTFLQSQDGHQHLVTTARAPAPVPVPAAGLLLLAALAGLGGLAARRRLA